MAAGWSTEETKALLGVWGDADIQTQLDGVARNRSIYQQIATALADLGYERTWQQCKTKIKNLTQRYRKVKDGNNVSGTSRTTCPLYDEIDAILGNRAASQPTTLLDSGGGEVSVEHTDVETVSSGSFPSVTTTPSTSSASSFVTTPAPSPSSSVVVTAVSSAATQRNAVTERKRGQKRKKYEDGSIAELAQIFEQAEERAAEREARYRERELELEAQAREREDRREERMMMMMNAMLQSQQCQPQLYPYVPPQQPPPFSGQPQSAPIESDESYDHM